MAEGAITHLAHILQVAILDGRHLAIHAVLHRHARRVVRIPKGAHACQIHSSLHVCNLSHSRLCVPARVQSASQDLAFWESQYVLRPKHASGQQADDTGME